MHQERQSDKMKKKEIQIIKDLVLKKLDFMFSKVKHYQYSFFLVA